MPSQNMVCRSTAVDTAEAEGEATAASNVESVVVSVHAASLTYFTPALAEVMELELKVEGMKCNDCSSRVAEALKV